MRTHSHYAAVFAVVLFCCAMLIKGFVTAPGPTTAAKPETISVEDIQRSIDRAGLFVTQSDTPF